MLNYTDEKLYELCRQYGEQAKFWRQKFAGLLPEVYRRHLYKKKGFGSIFEFAAKLAGMSEEQVSLVLSLHRRFEDKPALRNILEKGEVSVHKLARVVSIATTKNQEFLADQVKLLPQAALETLVRDEKTNCKDHAALPAGGKEDVLRTQKLCENLELAQLHISKEVQARLRILQQKGINIDTLLIEFLDNRELEIAQEKERLSTEVAPAKSRYIPAKIKTILKKEYGDKCSIPQCQKNAETIHHTPSSGEVPSSSGCGQRFALSKTHDPHYLAPLCSNHHKIAHSIDVKFHEAQIQARAG